MLWAAQPSIVEAAISMFSLPLRCAAFGGIGQVVYIFIYKYLYRCEQSFRGYSLVDGPFGKLANCFLGNVPVLGSVFVADISFDSNNTLLYKHRLFQIKSDPYAVCTLKVPYVTTFELHALQNLSLANPENELSAQ